jgi:hypothetical protein
VINLAAPLANENVKPRTGFFPSIHDHTLGLATSFWGHGHGHGEPPSTPEEALAQAKAGMKTSLLALTASFAALLRAYVTFSLEKKHYELLDHDKFCEHQSHTKTERATAASLHLDLHLELHLRTP